MATLVTQSIVRTSSGLNPTLAAAAAGGDLATPEEDAFLEVRNGHATLPRTVTLATPGTYKGEAIAETAITVPALGRRLVGPLTPELYRNPSDGMVHITYSDAAADVTIGVFKLD